MYINQDPLQVLHIVNIICADGDCTTNRPFSFKSPLPELEPSPDKDPDILATRFMTEHHKETGHSNFLSQSSIVSTVRYTVRE